MKVTYVPVDVNTTPPDRDGFIKAYQQAFGGAPYFEEYTPDDVLEQVWNPHLKDGIIVLAMLNSAVIGFGCALPLLKSPGDIQEFVEQSIAAGAYSADPSKVWYMSELGVLEDFRRHGIGTKLVKHRLLTITYRGDTHYVFRTAAEGSNSIHIYERVGAQRLPHLQDVSSSNQVVLNHSHSTERVYLHGDCDSALRKLLSA